MECQACGFVVDGIAYEKNQPFEEGGTKKAAFSQKFRVETTFLPGDIRAYIPHKGKRKFTSKEVEERFNQRKHKKVERKIRTLKKASKHYVSASQASQISMSEIMIEDGWESGNPGWKWDADVSNILRNTTLDGLGEEVHSLKSKMRLAIEGAAIPERGVFLISDADGDDRRIVTPKKEGSALEFYIMRTDDDGAYWFFDDFCKRLPVNKGQISNVLSSRFPLSTQSSIRCDRVFEQSAITTEMIREFTIKAGKALDFETNGLEDDTKPPLPFGDGILTEDYKSKISLCLEGDSTPMHIYRWVGFNELEEERIIEGVLRPSRHPLLLTQIPLAYSLAQRVYDSLRNNDQWRNISMKILNLIEDDLSWCNSTVSEMDRWWEEEVKKSSSMGDVPVTILRRSHQ